MKTLKKSYEQKKKYLKGTLPTVFASVEKENLKKKPLIFEKKNFFLVLLNFDENFYQNVLLGQKIDFFAKVNIPPQKNVHPLYPLLSLNCKPYHYYNILLLLYKNATTYIAAAESFLGDN